MRIISCVFLHIVQILSYSGRKNAGILFQELKDEGCRHAFKKPLFPVNRFLPLSAFLCLIPVDKKPCNLRHAHVGFHDHPVIKEIVDLPKEKHIVAESDAIGQTRDQGYSVEMTGVNFAYVENRQVIVNSDFIAKPNEIVALVGPSGEGKTTMIRLILGLVHPEEGQAVLRDAKGNTVEMNADLRQYFAYVPQGNTILSGTIAENMRMVREDATDGQIIEALKIACAWDFVEKLPEGINSSVGERGRGLSEGQAQRVAIARAILRDAPVLLLDEATSALDVTTERAVLRNIIKQRPNKTCIVTTHRPSVLNMCQRVYRVIDKQVTELSEEESSQMVMDF